MIADDPLARAADVWPVLAVGLAITALLIAYDLRRRHPRPQHAAPRVRGYVRRAGARWEYGLQAIDTGLQRRLGVRRTHAGAERAIDKVMHPGGEP